MVLPPEQVSEIRAALEKSQSPLFIYDDDPDGLCSFLLLYRLVQRGRGMMLKTSSKLGEEWVDRVSKYGADCVFVLDVPEISQDFLDKVKLPVYWIDHHTPLQLTGVHYYNPRIADAHAYIPTTRLAYEVVKGTLVAERDLWIAAVGSVADWHVPDFGPAFALRYPDLFSADISHPEDALYDTLTGKLARIFSFLLKGKTNDALACVKILTRIEDPYEILKGTTSRGRFVLKRFEGINKQYETLLQEALSQASRKRFFVFYYTEATWSFTSELSTELSHRYPKKVILICREKNEEYKCSLRSREKPIEPALKKAIQGLQATGGGHEYACGAVIKVADFELFLARLKKAY